MQRESFELEQAWAQLSAMIGWVAALFGAPAEIAARLAFLKKDRQDFLSWLAPLEALARRLLFIEAAALPALNAAVHFTPAGRIANAYRDAQPAELDGESARWRVMFRVGPRKPAGQPASSRREKAVRVRPDPLYNAIPLARRLEALARLAQNRAAIVRALARKLQARPAHVARAFAPYRHPARHCAEALGEAQEHADAARRRFADTS
ncbi:MAG: hypothetical protein AB7M12_08270 [Hyphomonadaceae bacterium]